MATQAFKTDVLIIGAGFAGASTAYHLSRRFTGSIHIVEREEIPGFHASGRNASLLLQSLEPPEIRQFAVASRRGLEEISETVGFRPTGSFLLGSKEELSKQREPDLLESRYRDPELLRQAIPYLRGHDFEAALWTPSDGVVDISRLLQFYLVEARKAGVQIHFDRQVRSISRGSTFQVETELAVFEAGCVVNAAGAWVGEIGKMAGATDIPFFPLKRHLFVLEGIDSPEPDMPFVWSLAKNFYFRPESGGLLFSVCDEEPAASLEPTVNGEVSELLAEVIWRELPALQEAVQRRVWSCFRTKTPDHQFVLGWDPKLDGFFWVAGLGGHGMGTSFEVGRRAALSIQAPERPVLPAVFLPDRFNPVHP